LGSWFTFPGRCGAEHRSEVEERARDRGSGLLQLVDESDRRFLPRSHIVHVWTKLCVIGKIHRLAVEHYGFICDREFPAVRLSPNHLDGVSTVQRRGPDDEFVFCGHKNSFRLVVEAAIAVAVTLSIEFDRRESM
jgi:hypothetical protein